MDERLGAKTIPRITIQVASLMDVNPCQFMFAVIKTLLPGAKGKVVLH